MKAKKVYENIFQPKSPEDIRTEFNKLNPKAKLKLIPQSSLEISSSEINKINQDFKDLANSNLEKIKGFARTNHYEFGFNKNKNPFISIPVDYEIWQSYDRLVWPAEVEDVKYAFTYTDWGKGISLRKTWYGTESPNAREYWRMSEEQMLAKFRSEKDNFKYKNLKQSLLGRFETIEEALSRTSLNIKKELRKNEG